MATTTSHNKKSSAVKRILSEARELEEATPEFVAAPLDDNIFEWHFTLRGPSSTEFEEGYYHGRIILPSEYPFRPPDVMILTPNGRWELNKKICLTFTGYHEEMWQPAWGIRTALIGVQAFMGARAEAALGVGSLDYPPAERERLAKASGDWRCPVCEKTNSQLLPVSADVRVVETLPEGLTIDPSGGKPPQDAEAKAASTSASGTQAVAAEQQNGVPALYASSRQTTERQLPPPINTFGSNGPSDQLLADIVGEQGARRETSTTSSRVTTPGAHTPARSLREDGIGADAGTEDNTHAPAGQPPSSGNAANQGAQTQPTDSRPAGAVAPPVPAPVAPRAPPGREEVESVRRLAVLDRAIATVIFLLLALFIRRALNAWA